MSSYLPGERKEEPMVPEFKIDSDEKETTEGEKTTGMPLAFRFLLMKDTTKLSVGFSGILTLNTEIILGETEK